MKTKIKTKRNRRPVLQLMLVTVEKAIATREKLESWNVNPGSTLEDMGSQIEAMIEGGFTAPAIAKEPKGFQEGDLVRIKAEHLPKYKGKYSEEDLNSLVYGFYDTVCKVASLETATTDGTLGRVVFVKPRQIEKRQ